MRPHGTVPFKRRGDAGAARGDAFWFADDDIAFGGLAALVRSNTR